MLPTGNITQFTNVHFLVVLLKSLKEHEINFNILFNPIYQILQLQHVSNINIVLNKIFNLFFFVTKSLKPGVCFTFITHLTSD